LTKAKVYLGLRATFEVQTLVQGLNLHADISELKPFPSAP
jgi:hypothetical protein